MAALHPPKLSVSEGGIFVDELPFTPIFDYSYDGVLRSVADSLQRLGTNRIDIALIHDIDRWTHGDAYDERFAEVVNGALPALARLKADGVIGAIGAGVNEIAACEGLATLPQIDCFMLAGRYTLLERDGVAALFAQCIQREIAILAAAPFNSGILATGNIASARYNYLPAPPEIRAEVDALERLGAQYGVALAAAALQFPLQHPAVVSVVAGYRSRREAEQGAAAFADTIPAAYWHALDVAPARPQRSSVVIVSCGEALIDFVPATTPAGEAAYVPRPGGSPFNVALTVGRLGVPAGFLGSVSTDFFGAPARCRTRGQWRYHAVHRSTRSAQHVGVCRPRVNRTTVYVLRSRSGHALLVPRAALSGRRERAAFEFRCAAAD